MQRSHSFPENSSPEELMTGNDPYIFGEAKKIIGIGQMLGSYELRSLLVENADIVEGETLVFEFFQGPKDNVVCHLRTGDRGSHSMDSDQLRPDLDLMVRMASSDGGSSAGVSVRAKPLSL
jgi:hypothetical protein